MSLYWTQLISDKYPLNEYPELLDDKQTPLLKLAIWILLGGSAMIIATLLVFAPENSWRIYANAGLMALAIAAHTVLRYRGAIATVRLLIIGSWILTTAVSFAVEGLRTPILIAYPIILIFGGWLLGARFCIRLFFASSLAVAVMAISQQAGFIGASKAAIPAVTALVYLVILAISAVMTLYLVKLFRERYVEERRLNEELLSSLQTIKLRQTELRVAATAFESQEAMMITDANGVILRVNKAFTGSTGYTPDEAVGQKPNLLKSGRHGADFYRAMWETLHRTGGWQGEIWDRHKNGDVYPVWLTISEVKDEDGVVTNYVGAHFDITDQKHAEDEIRTLNLGLEQRVAQRTAELERAKDAALAADRAKSDFLASMSHEIRTPLNAILGYSQLIGMAPDLPEETKDYAQEIGRAGQHLLALINEMLDLARIEANQLCLSFQPVPVESLLADCLGMIKPIANKHGIELISLIDTGATTVVSADYVRLRQVVINLLSNAIKYNRPKGNVTLSCEVIDNNVRIGVIDSGPGIPIDKQGHLFNAFDRIGKESGTVEGTGIGLVISKRLVEAMGGKIGFKSVEGQGSAFWAEFPVIDSEDIPLPEVPAPLSAPGKVGQQTVRRVLLYVEDSPASLRLMQKVIAKWPDVELRGAATAEIGVEMARAEPPALILMDINLPGMDGYEALAQLKNDPKTAQIPVIALTANAMTSDKERAQAAGFCAFITKPVDLSSLYDTLHKTLDKSGV